MPLIQSKPAIAYESLHDQLKRLIIYPLRESSISTVIIIDALDECEGKESASAILSVLGQLVSEIPKVKFFLTSHPEPGIFGGFQPPLSAEIKDSYVLQKIKPDQVNSDIWQFFKISLELVGHQSGLDNWPAEGQLDQLSRQAAGLFVNAAVMVKFVDNNRRGPREQLNTLLQLPMIGDHGILDPLYMLILQGVFGTNKPEHDDKTHSILGAIVLALNPLSPATIATLLGFNTEDVLPSLSLVNPLLVLQGINHPVQLFHKSFLDFITDSTRCTNQRFHIPPPDHHLELLVGCLDFMNLALKKNMYKLPDSVTNSDVNDLKERTEKYIDPALRYACTSWHIHLSNTYTTPICAPTITPTLRQFLGTKFLFWLEVLSVLGSVRSAVEALQVAVNWLGVR